MAPPVVEPLPSDNSEGIAFTLAPLKKEEKPAPLLASLLDDDKEKKKDKGKDKERDDYNNEDRDKEKDNGKRKKDKESDPKKKRKLSALEEIKLRDQVTFQPSISSSF